MNRVYRRNYNRRRKKRRPGHNLASRLQKRREPAQRFPTDMSVPLTNRLSEHDLRTIELHLKISGGFRSWQGARDFATLRSVPPATRKHCRYPIEALRAGSDALLASQRQPLTRPVLDSEHQPPS